MSKRGKLNYSKCTRDIPKEGEGVGSRITLKPEYEEMRHLIYNTPYGGFRRGQILGLLKRGVEISVNGMHEVQTKNDPDLKRLLKEGKIEMFTNASHWNSFFKRTYLRYKNV